MPDLLKAIPPEAYVALVTAIITATVMLVTVHVSNKANTHRLLLQFEHEANVRRTEIRREKLEELYVLSGKWVTALDSHYLPYLDVMRGKLTYDQALDLDIERGKDVPDFHRLEMLIDMYYPQVRNAEDAILQLQSRANDTLASHKREYKRGQTDGVEFVDPLTTVLNAIDETGKALRARLRGQINVA